MTSREDKSLHTHTHTHNLKNKMKNIKPEETNWVAMWSVLQQSPESEKMWFIHSNHSLALTTASRFCHSSHNDSLTPYWCRKAKKLKKPTWWSNTVPNSHVPLPESTNLDSVRPLCSGLTHGFLACPEIHEDKNYVFPCQNYFPHP